MAHLNPAQRLAAGLHPPPSVSQPFAAVQAAWRFYANPRVSLPQLVGPLVDSARAEMESACEQYGLVVMDWCHLHYNSQQARADCVDLAHKNDHGYELLGALLISDRDGRPMAPLGMELRARDGVYSTRSRSVLAPPSQLDGLEPLMAEATSHQLGKPLVFIIDAEADSVAHYRQWQTLGYRFLVRGDAHRKVLWDGAEVSLGQVADQLHEQQRLHRGAAVNYKGRTARVFVGETPVVLHRAARPHRVGADGKKRHRTVPGEPIELRLIVSEVRDSNGNVLARWLLLSNLPDSVNALTLAQWYCWRWGIESFHKLLKQSGHFIEQWQQESASAIAKRLLIAAMACVIVWRLARDDSPAAAELRDLLIQLSGRQIKRGRNRPSFTEPALLAGLGILLPMLALLQEYDPAHLTRLLATALPGALTLRRDSG